MAVKFNSISGIGIILFCFFLCDINQNQKNGEIKHFYLICSAITIIVGFVYQCISDTYKETSMMEKNEITARIQDKLYPYFASIRKKLEKIIRFEEEEQYSREPQRSYVRRDGEDERSVASKIDRGMDREIPKGYVKRNNINTIHEERKEREEDGDDNNHQSKSCSLDPTGCGTAKKGKAKS